MSFQALCRYDLRSTGKNQPFIIGGLGLANTDLTFSFGGGVDIPLNSMTLNLSTRYQQFLFDIGDLDGGGALVFMAQARFP